MSIKLNGATNGSVELDVPAAIGSDLSVTIPATAGELTVKATDGSVDLGAIDIAASAPADSVNIDSSGRLLVGTSSTAQNSTLVLQGRGSATGSAIVRASTTEAVPGNGFGLGSLYFCNSVHATVSGVESVRDSGTWTNGTSHPSRLTFFTTADAASSPTARMTIRENGQIEIPDTYNFTSANAANVFINSTGFLRRSTSSIKYKTDVETLEDSYADAILGCRPVWYRSTTGNDNPEHGYWGFIAEEVAEIDPRLVHWKTTEISYDENGSAVEAPCDPEPEGVQYDRFVPHLLNLIKRQKEQIETQGTAIAALETRLTALEGGAS